jgi:hypothetical protein
MRVNQRKVARRRNTGRKESNMASPARISSQKKVRYGKGQGGQPAETTATATGNGRVPGEGDRQLQRPALEGGWRGGFCDVMYEGESLCRLGYRANLDGRDFAIFRWSVENGGHLDLGPPSAQPTMPFAYPSPPMAICDLQENLCSRAREDDAADWSV